MTGSIDRRTALALIGAGLSLPSLARAKAPDRAPASLIEPLDSAVQGELKDKAIPSISLALVDRSGVIWSGAWGFSDAGKTRPATADTVYRAGSISKLFTDLLVMQLVEAGRLELDKPVQTWLPDFNPANPFGGDITLRRLMTHRSGLVREPPVGSYFDTSAPPSAAVVRSLNATHLVAAPGTVTKYSNAGLQVVAGAIEAAAGAPYETVVRQRLLDPLGMTKSGFTVAGVDLPYAEMGSYDGARFPAPVFESGRPAAGGLCTSANELGRFVHALLSGGQVSGGRLVRAETLAAMLRPQPGSGPADQFALGFDIGDFHGQRIAGHAGGIYGFTSDLRFLPDAGVGVVVLTSLECPSARRIADFALGLMLAERTSAPAPVFATSQRVSMAEAKAMSGHYANGSSSLFLREIGGALYIEGAHVVGEIRRQASGFAVDDAHNFVEGFEIDAGSVRRGDQVFTRSDWAKPAPPLDDLAGLIGEYGWDYNYIRVYERDGRPFVRIEWFDYQPMTQVDRDTLAFPREGGLYPLEALKFIRDDQGRGASISLNGIVFPRRDFGAEMLARTRAMGRNRADLRAEAKRATPPAETGKAPADLVALQSVDPTIRLDVRYATANNFLGFPLYAREGAYMERPAAEAVARTNAVLHAQGYGLVIHDAYRPWFVTKMFWDATPPEGHIFVADPSQGSRHNRGCAVDLSLVDLKTGELVQMTGGYDEMSSRSYPNYVGGTSIQRWRRDLLRTAMEAQGFEVYEFEWWHFDFQGWDRYPILDLDFDEIDALNGRSASDMAQRLASRLLAAHPSTSR